MKTSSIPLLILSVCLLFLTSCTSLKTAKIVPEGMIKDLTPAFNAGDLNSTVDGLIILMDASSSMGETHLEYSKFDVAKAFIARMNKTMPPISTVSGLRTFGHAQVLSRQNTNLFYGMAPYNRAEMAKGLSAVTPWGGPTPISDAITAVNEDFANIAGNKVLIIVSDGKDLDDKPIIAAQKLQAKMGQKLCIYTVLVGEDSKGKALLKKIAAVSQCGHMVLAHEINSVESMVDYVTDVFFNKEDQGLGYHKAELLIKSLGKIHFDFDESILTDSEKYILNQHIKKLVNTPEIKIIIQGHTSAKGAEAYNQILSEKRALAVKNYLINIGNISSERFSTIGFGETKPLIIESNPKNINSAEAISNRRVVFDIAEH
ncbi:OmpA family protein [Desulfobacterales bacterium HSG17]|nr:OmpA family protein [Desulfobacterales bacterium HSG17]